MADEPTPDPTTAPDLRKQGEQQAAGWLDMFTAVQLPEKLSTTGYNFVVKIIGWVLRNAATIGALLGKTLADAENTAQPEFNRLAEVAVADLFGVNVSMTAGAGGRGSRAAAADAVGDMLLRAFSGAAAGGGTGTGALEPGDGPAKAFLSTMTQLSLEGWLEGWLVEALSLGQLETFGELDDKIAHTLGLGRASAAVHGPLVRHLIVTPLEWKVNKEHRPALLTAAAAVQQFLRGKWTREQLDEELARQGYAPARIEALIFAGTKQIAESDITDMVTEGLLDQEAATPFLKALGYSDDLVEVWKSIDKFRRERAWRSKLTGAAIAAYIARDIDGVDLQDALDLSLPNTEENNAARAYAEHARVYNVKHLSHAEIKDAVVRGMLATPDYRAWLEREGYPPDEALTLELLLEVTTRGQQEAAKKKAELEAQRAADKAAKDAAAKQKAAELAAKKRMSPRRSPTSSARSLSASCRSTSTRRGSARSSSSPATSSSMVELLQQRRDDYLAAQERAKKAKGPETAKTIALGALERAVSRRRDRRAVPRAPGRRQLRRRRRRRHGAAARRRARRSYARGRRTRRGQSQARIKGLSLAQVEKSVRQGLTTLDAYEQWLRAQGFEPQSAALLRASLDRHSGCRGRGREARAGKRARGGEGRRPGRARARGQARRAHARRLPGEAHRARRVAG
jgi:hypothetical protein